MLEALLSESSERRAALEARQAARAAQLLARQDQMAAAADVRRRERLQHIGHLPPVPKPATRKEEVQQLQKWVMPGHNPSLTLACTVMLRTYQWNDITAHWLPAPVLKRVGS